MISGPGEAFGQESWLGTAVLDAAGLVLESDGSLVEHLGLRPGEILDEPRLESALAAALTGNRVWLRLGPVNLAARPVSRGPMPHAEFLFFEADQEEQSVRELDRESRRRRLFEGLTAGLSQSAGFDAVAQALVGTIHASLDLSGAAIWRSRSADSLVLAAHRGFSAAAAAAAEVISNQTPPFPAWLAWSGSRVLECSNVRLDPDIWAWEARGLERPGSVICLPLAEGDRRLGVLELAARSGDGEFGADRWLHSRLAEIAGSALARGLDFDRLEEQAHFDPLTGLANRRRLFQVLRERLEETARTGDPLGLIMCDVDHFRRFNEDYGHSAGDEVLRRVAAAMMAELRPYDTAGRYGGEEFTIILPGCDLEGAAVVAERLRRRIAQVDSGVETGLTVSLGCAAANGDFETAEGLIRIADLALYRAKRRGRNQVSTGNRNEEQDQDRIDPAMLALTCLREEHRSAAERRLELAGPVLESLSGTLGLRPGHVELLRAAVVLGPWLESGLNETAAAEIQHGLLRGAVDLLAESKCEKVGRDNGAVSALRWIEEHLAADGPGRDWVA
ncbi:MAG: sensor domain-containing diguanylate cyclase [Fimbriimonadaceae bacterium]|nr:sensor domain-containing diguanylate cyclase [Fimbriimonadaceae bacterium]